jgi:hypothetical protein
MRIFGYKFNVGNLTIIPEEAKIVKMIFADYLAGLGRNAIMKKLIQLSIPTKLGGQWSETTIAGMLKNEKYIDDLCLQKSFITDHLTKRQKRNDGELPKYYIEDNHEGIIDKATFDAVQAETARRAERHKANKAPKKQYELTGLVRCGKCGAPYRRKHAAAGRKYERIVWDCTTYNTLGKSACNSQQVPEDILLDKIAEVSGWGRIAEITVPEHFCLTFSMKDGTVQETGWQHRSRSESWTDEMKEQARQNARKRGEG